MKLKFVFNLAVLIQSICFFVNGEVLQQFGHYFITTNISSESFENSTQITFPKCCPLEYYYDIAIHGCTRRSENDTTTSLQMKNDTFQLQCPERNYATVDFLITRHEDVLVNPIDHGLRYMHATKQATASYGRYCIDDAKSDTTGTFVLRACIKMEEACGPWGRRCILKCCPVNKIYVKSTGRPKCKPFFDVGFDVSTSRRVQPPTNDSYAIIWTGRRKKFRGDDDEFFIDANGVFFYRNEYDDMDRCDVQDAFYCLEHYHVEGDDAPPTLYDFIFPPPNTFTDVKFYVQGVLLIASCVFLLATIICYVLLPEMQNLHGRATLMFCIVFFVSCLTLGIAQLYGVNVPQNVCTAIGFTIIFAFQGSFAWMNVICFDMWMAFGTMRVLDVKNKQKERRKFLCYNLYAWGVPIFFTGSAFIVFSTNCLPDGFVPRIGTQRCFFDSGTSYDYLIFFCLPVAIMVSSNCMFFARTAIYCARVKNEIARIRSIARANEKERKRLRFAHDKEKFIMLLKLFLVMGILWTFEVISSLVSFKKSKALHVIESVFDFINCSTGIIIFCIFILKRRVLVSLRTRLGCSVPTQRRPSAIITEVTGHTSLTDGSSPRRHSIQPLQIGERRTSVVTNAPIAEI